MNEVNEVEEKEPLFITRMWSSHELKEVVDSMPDDLFIEVESVVHRDLIDGDYDYLECKFEGRLKENGKTVVFLSHDVDSPLSKRAFYAAVVTTVAHDIGESLDFFWEITSQKVEKEE